MSFFVLPESETALGSLASSFGTGIGQGLQQQLETFHKEKEKEKLGDQFESVGWPRQLAGLDPQVIKQFMAVEQKKSLMEQLFGSPQEDTEALPPTETPREPPRETSGVGDQHQPTKEVSARDVQAAALLDPGLGRAIGQERKFQHQERQQIKARNLKVFDKASSDLKTIKEADIGLEQLENLSKEIGKTQGQKFFERFGRTYRFNKEGGFTKIGKATSTPLEERYVKLIADQTKTIKDDFGARITNLDLEVFLRRFPDLMMTPEGRESIFATMRDYKESKRIYNQALKNEIKLNKGLVNPYELDEIVEKKIAPKIAKIRERIASRGFSKNITQDIATKILKEAKGDKNLARKIAEKKGYKL